MKFTLDIEVTDGKPTVRSCQVTEPERIQTRKLVWTRLTEDYAAYETARAEAPELGGVYEVKFQAGYPTKALLVGRGGGHGGWGVEIKPAHGQLHGSILWGMQACDHHFRDGLLKQIAERQGVSTPPAEALPTLCMTTLSCDSLGTWWFATREAAHFARTQAPWKNISAAWVSINTVELPTDPVKLAEALNAMR